MKRQERPSIVVYHIYVVTALDIEEKQRGNGQKWALATLRTNFCQLGVEKWGGTMLQGARQHHHHQSIEEKE